MLNETIRTLHSDMVPEDHPYLQGRLDAAARRSQRHRHARIVGRDPEATSTASICATRRIRCTSSLGRYHPFDGDGMIHMISLRDGKADYRNRFVQTKGLSGRNRSQANDCGLA